MTDTETLVARWKASDERAAEALYSLHRDATFRLAGGLLGGGQYDLRSGRA